MMEDWQGALVVLLLIFALPLIAVVGAVSFEVYKRPAYMAIQVYRVYDHRERKHTLQDIIVLVEANALAIVHQSAKRRYNYLIGNEIAKRKEITMTLRLAHATPDDDIPAHTMWASIKGIESSSGEVTIVLSSTDGGLYTFDGVFANRNIEGLSKETQFFIRKIRKNHAKTTKKGFHKK